MALFTQFSSADGNFEVSLATKATLYHTGLVEVRTCTDAVTQKNCVKSGNFLPTWKPLWTMH